MKHVISMLGATVVVAAGLLYGCEYQEQPYRYYENYTPALHDGNWVPDIFPHNIVRIHEQHDIDTNEVWLHFSQTEPSIDAGGFGYKPIQPFERDLFIRKPFRLPWKERWWQVDLSEDFQFYQGEHSGAAAYIAVDGEGNVYWWRGAV